MKAVLLFLTVVSILLAGCSRGISGTYQGGGASFTFESGGKVIVEVPMMGLKTEAKYEVDGKNVKVIGPLGNDLMTIKDDSTLIGAGGVVFAKAK
jgi:hypothetical protein